MSIGQLLLDRQRRKTFEPGVTGRLIRGCEAQGDDEDVYMERYFLYRSKVFNVYLHHFLRSDTDRALHDHPWNFVTVILSGGYWEHGPHPIAPWPETSRVWQGSVLFRRATHKHYVELPTRRVTEWRYGGFEHFWEDAGPERPAITLCIVGKKWREWGFFEPDGWIEWRKAFARWGCKP